MEFTHSATGEKIAHMLEPCSLIILSGDARYKWKHGISSRKTDKYKGLIIQRGRRVSLTFRSIISY